MYSEKILSLLSGEIRHLAEKNATVIVAIDGRCASGKTTMAELLRQELHGVLLHMDDFFLQPEQRDPERLAIPGENVDHERFLQEVLEPLHRGEKFVYRPYDCHTRSFLPPVEIIPGQINIVEGAYCCHPTLWPYYDLHIFMTVDGEKQLRRIAGRNGKEALPAFQNRWIPLEEKYFAAYDIAARCELCIKSED